ncbi:thioredoxin family protein [Desulfovibrio piger]|nr:thioredoxin family protein [Desulfovibrio piger]
MEIKVLGPGCAKCKEAEDIVRTAVRDAGSDARVEKVTDLREMMALGVMATPAVVIDGKIKCTGRVPTPAEVREWITGPDAAR